ncbi:MAG: hypothetical protein LBJ71_03880 [Holosporaceae bacterium]|jgi:hypothetical protein|nr:hypothetical protein [Holosporaceae bacterium]
MLFTEAFIEYIEKTPQEEILRKNLLLEPNDKLYREAVRYLGYGNGKNISPGIDSMVQKGLIEICATAEPRVMCRYFSVKECNFALHQQEGLILMGATLGVSIDRLLNRTQIQNMAYALVLDSCATAAIEEICDNLEIDLTNIYAHRGRHLTNRFSPGYGSLPLSTQPKLLLLLDAERKIGLGTTQSFLLTPSKSVTAMMWVSQLQPELDRSPCKRHSSCNICNMRHTCNFRRREVPC